MKILLSDIVNSKEAFVKLVQEKLPIKTAFGVAEIIGLVEKKISTYETMRTNLITEKYGEEEEAGSGNFRVQPSKLKEFVAELTELLSVEVELNFSKVSLPDNISMTPADMFALSWMLDMGGTE